MSAMFAQEFSAASQQMLLNAQLAGGAEVLEVLAAEFDVIADVPMTGAMAAALLREYKRLCLAAVKP